MVISLIIAILFVLISYFIFYEVPIKNIVLKFLFGLVVIIFILWISIMILRLYFEKRGERND